MQRWIAAGMIAMLVLVSAAGIGAYQYRQNRPCPIWIPLPLSPRQSNPSKLSALAKDLHTRLSEPGLLLKISNDLNLADKWQLESVEAAARELASRLFVEIGETTTPAGRVPSINIGVRGKRHERATSSEAAMRLVQEVLKIQGVKAN